MNADTDKIAIVGMAGRFPGAKNIQEYWANLLAGKECITFFSDEELEETEIDYKSLKDNPDYVPARGVINDAKSFDAQFFGFSPREAAITDPQHRVWLETVWQAFEDAGCNPYDYPGAIGVFAGSFNNTYLLNNLLRDQEKLENYIRLRSTESFQILSANDPTHLPTKTAYKFNLKGPAINVQTACSTSLVAISQACQSLYSFESDMVIAGGVCILNPQETGYLYQEGAIPSPDGRCKPFDKDAAGTVFSNGVGAVVLKRYDDALKDKDRIYGLVSGWALNNDGIDKVSYTAPSVDGQASCIEMAQTFANLTSDKIAYVETHGTGTQLGDPIEIAALRKAFQATSDKKQFCGIGSVKANIGHTDAAAGVASFIKSALSVYNKTIPQSINVETPNPQLNLQDSPFYVNTQNKKWEQDDRMIIGVSSFGIGGTNAHVIVEQHQQQELKSADTSSDERYILPLSAKSSSALDQRIKNLVEFVKDNPTVNINDLAYTLWHGRNHMSHRTSIVLNNFSELEKQTENAKKFVLNEDAKSHAFMFPGQGSQFIGMGKELYDSNNDFRQQVDQGFAIYQELTGSSLKELVFAETINSETEAKLAETSITQPALFIIQYSLAKLLQEQGLKADYLIGHSIGEYAAACLSGVCDFATALKIVVKRGQLMQSMPKGTMFAVRASKEKLEELADGIFEVAAQNAPGSCTISFSSADTDRIKNLLEKNEVQFMELQTSHAFHSKYFDPILDEFAEYVSQFTLQAPIIPLISCLTGEFLTSEQAQSGKYWASQLRNSVLFFKGVETIVGKGECTFIEVGANTHLSSILRGIPEIKNKRGIVPTIGKAEDSSLYMLETILANVWCCSANYTCNLSFIADNAQKIGLPTYPFKKEEHWVTAVRTKVETQQATVASEKELATPASLKKSIKEVIQKLTGIQPDEISDDITFHQLGIDSISLATFAVQIAKKYKVKVAMRQLLDDVSTTAKLEAYIHANTATDNKRSKGGKLSREWSALNNIVLIQPKGSKVPLILINGERALDYSCEGFGCERPVYTFVELGSDGEYVPFDDINTLAKEYVKEILTKYNGDTFLLGGFSAGGVLAYEVALQLQEMGKKVPKLIMLDSKNPQLKEALKSKFRRYLNIKNLIYVLSLKTSLKFKDTVIKLFFALNKRLPMYWGLRNHYVADIYIRLSNTFTPKKYNGELLLIKVEENIAQDVKLGWSDYVEDITLASISGDHLGIIREKENRKQTSGIIRGFLDSE